MAVFESKWKPGLSRADAVDLVCEAIEAGIFNDLGSGSNVDVSIIEKGKSEMLRNYKRPNERVAKEKRYVPHKGATAVLKMDVRFSLLLSFIDCLIMCLYRSGAW